MSWLTGYRRLNHHYERHLSPPTPAETVGECPTVPSVAAGPSRCFLAGVTRVGGKSYRAPQPGS